MTEQGMSAGGCEGERRFWRWWRAGAVSAGVQEADLPDLSFPEELLVGGAPVTGAFQVDLDPASHQLRMLIQIRADLCSRMTVRPASAGASSASVTFPRMPIWMRGASDGVLALALQCAYYEQSAWALWRFREVGEPADRVGVKRAQWLVRRWLGEVEPRYRPPGYSRGIRPIRFAGREWVVSDGWVVPRGGTPSG